MFLYILMWFERATEFLKIEDLKSNTSLANLVEEFYDVALSICKINTEGKRQIQDTFVLRLGVLVTDSDILFCLRLEAVRTLNSILDVTTKEERKKISLSEELALLLVELAKLILNAGDYEMQVAISEALCRMTLKKWREDLVYQWFVNRDFADSFKAINDREFETDCRKFLNKVNSFLGDERRVYTFPCIKAFLEMKELYMPEDPKLEQFWIDFNVGSSCISFFINDPVGTLWDSINLPSENVNSYEIRETDGQKICIIHTGVPVFASNKEGNTVKIIFDSEFDILTAVKKIYGEEKLLKGTSSEKIGPELIDTQDFLSLEEKETTSSPSEAGQGLDGPVDVPDVEKNLYQEVNKTSPVKQNDSFAFEIQSETEASIE
ncbi:synaptonemal complex protein 2-like isoform X2 [Amia ocellicauda]|uniref:synaptonemal complex protein 2-like isoform X2 n=1 Tax=Amia ocellicauda TaxID=2972642 RepID=UPI003464D819